MKRPGVDVRLALATMTTWPPVRWWAAAAATAVTAVATGVPTGLLATGWYTRMTPVTWWSYPVWLLTALLVGLTFATYVRSVELPGGDRVTKTALGGLTATLAIGCPICNRLVVGVLGTSGALRFWAPAQPLLGVLGVLALAAGLLLRLRGSIACAVTQTATDEPTPVAQR